MRLSHTEVELTRERLAKINARAAKKGFTGRFELDVEETTVTEMNAVGFEITTVWYDCTITGDAPSYNGWTLLGTIDWLSETEMIVNVSPGITTMIERDSFKNGWCDHCQRTTYRKKYYIVGNADTGEQYQVGSTCLKDFLGWQGSYAFVGVDDVTGEIDELFGGGGYARDYSWTPETVLAAAYAAIKVNGYVRAGDYNAQPTKEITLDILDPPNNPKLRREIKETYSSLVVESTAVANEVKAFLLSDDFNGDSDYVLNLKTLARQATVTPRHVGYLASAPQAYARWQERTLIRKKDQLCSEYVGEVADRLTLEVKVQSIKWFENDWGSSTRYTMVDRAGHVFKWFASKDALGDRATDNYVTIVGTVKKHEEYNGLKSTVLTRCKVK